MEYALEVVRLDFVAVANNSEAVVSVTVFEIVYSDVHYLRSK